MKYVNGVVVKPSLSFGEEWTGTNVLTNIKAGDLYLRSCHSLRLQKPPNILDYCSTEDGDTTTNHDNDCNPEDDVDYPKVLTVQ
eukprot:Seg6528.2 transcript_id=Seg6528.2/GoldUCD/mRNA.D3Y31 product="hypothetical protein" pseudo=true protein_id=Seg6528.2/GoldUCD/D3Y31